MENKKNYYTSDNRDMQDFNPRFNDLYQEYSHSQQENHTFNLNGTIYVHNHHGGEPIPVGKAKTPAGSRSTAKPNRTLSRVGRNGQVQAEAQGGNPPGTGGVAVQRPGAKRPGINKSRARRRNGWNQTEGKKVNRVARGFIAGFVVMFTVAMIVTVVESLVDFDNDTIFSEEDVDTYESQDIAERENPSLAEPITEEGVVYIMGGYIQIGATADTLWETYDMPEFHLQEPVQPGENYYITLDLGEKYGVAAIILNNMSGTETQDVNKFVITDVSADYYTEWGEDFDATRTQTDCEIIGGITIGMDYTEALWALSEVCDNPDMLNSSEGNQGHLLGYSEKYYYSITIVDEEVSAISVTLRDTETE